jgi:hypothetical protein
MQRSPFHQKSIKVVSVFTVAVFLAFLAVSPFSARQLNDQFGNATSAPRFSCRGGFINGTYGANITGTFLTPSPVPLAAVGTFTFNEARQVSGTATTSFGGMVTTSPFTGSYTLNDDCTGTMSTTQDGFTINSNIVLVDEGNEIVVIETNPGAIVTGVLKRR